jgi:hypothetical protein
MITLDRLAQDTSYLGKAGWRPATKRKVGEFDPNRGSCHLFTGKVEKFCHRFQNKGSPIHQVWTSTKNRGLVLLTTKSIDEPPRSMNSK